MEPIDQRSEAVGKAELDKIANGICYNCDGELIEISPYIFQCNTCGGKEGFTVIIPDEGGREYLNQKRDRNIKITLVKKLIDHFEEDIKELTDVLYLTPIQVERLRNWNKAKVQKVFPDVMI